MAKKKPKPDSQFTMTLNGHTLSGVKRGSVWHFECPSWPDLAGRATNMTVQVERFTKRALAEATTLSMTVVEEQPG